jgi:hypothetical protein
VDGALLVDALRERQDSFNFYWGITMKLLRKLPLFFFLLITSAVVLAQEDSCPAIVDTALKAADTSCNTTARNQVCYGNIKLTAEAQPDVTSLTLDKPGDMAAMKDVKTIALSPLDAPSKQWGVALMRLQANLPDTLPGQNVTFLMFGDVQVQNAIDPNAALVTLNASPTQRLNVRVGPSTSEKLVARVAGKDTVVVDGRLADNSWVHVALSGGQSGWVAASYLNITGDLGTVTVISETDTTPHPPSPMQAFYFKSGIGDAPCQTAPSSGLLMQTPGGTERVAFKINGVDVSFGSTLYLQAQPSKEMIINVVEGFARAEAFGKVAVAIAGSRLRIPLDANLNASAAPIGPEVYSNDDVKNLPVNLLERAITVAPPAPKAELQTILDGVPISGTWKITRHDCPSTQEHVGTVYKAKFTSDGKSLLFNVVTYNRIQDNRYHDTRGQAGWGLIVFPDRLEFTRGDGCHAVSELVSVGE